MVTVKKTQTATFDDPWYLFKLIGSSFFFSAIFAGILFGLGKFTQFDLSFGDLFFIFNAVYFVLKQITAAQNG